jgi:hypothetical protein
MRLAPTSSVPEGALLARDVQIGRADGIPLLRAGVQLTARYREGLARAGVHAVYVEDNLSEGIDVETLVSDETRSVATRAVSDAYKAARAKTVSGKPLEESTIENLSGVVERILLEIESTGSAALALADLCAADGYTFQHSVDVTALGLLIGERMLRSRSAAGPTTRASGASTASTSAFCSSVSGSCCTTSESSSCRSRSCRSPAS